MANGGVMRKRPRIWVVEMRARRGRVWYPTDCAIACEAGRAALADWQQQNPDDEFRLRAYTPRPMAMRRAKESG